MTNVTVRVFTDIPVTDEMAESGDVLKAAVESLAKQDPSDVQWSYGLIEEPQSE